MRQRYIKACEVAGDLMKAGYEVFSPIAHSHPISKYSFGHSSVQTDFDFWMKQDLAVLKHCDILVVLGMEGWSQSRGVAREIEFARSIGKPVYIIGDHHTMFQSLTQMILDDAENYTDETYEDFLDTEDASGDAIVNSLNQ
jgi:nucleoside 2-deoxyribosyltransferase